MEGLFVAFHSSIYQMWKSEYNIISSEDSVQLRDKKNIISLFKAVILLLKKQDVPLASHIFKYGVEREEDKDVL
jgi:hypothetical protein